MATSYPEFLTSFPSTEKRLLDKLDGHILSETDPKIKMNKSVQFCRMYETRDPAWSLLAGQIKMKYLKEYEIPDTFSESTELVKVSLNEDYYNFVMKNKDVLNQMVVSERDYTYNIFSVETLCKSYLLKHPTERNITTVNSKIAESPQYLHLRVATFLWYNTGRIEDIKTCYDILSKKLLSQASPTQFNAGLKYHQLSSCFTNMKGDSIDKLGKSWIQIAKISKHGGGIGSCFTPIRHSSIGTQGASSRGVVGWVRIDESILSEVNQGGKRKGSATCYIRTWHIDVISFIEMKLPQGEKHMRAQDIFYGLMISDEFMRRAENDEDWIMFCPKMAPGLVETYGAEFECKYRQYEKKFNEGTLMGKKMKARQLLRRICQVQHQTGMPFMIYIDAMNKKSCQLNIGPILLSNLCTEIALSTDEDHMGVCNLASICLPKCVENSTFNWELLGELSQQAVLNLNRVIEMNYYIPNAPEIERGCKRSLPLGIGVQGLSDVASKLDMCWDSPEFSQLNKDIFETIYYHTVKQSVELAKEVGPYSMFKGSPFSKGLFDFDLWHREENNSIDDIDIFDTSKSRYDWESLRKDMVTYGIRNSQLTALMPTASTAHINGNTESFEPASEIMYVRNVLSGRFLVVNEYCVNDLKSIGMWKQQVIHQLLSDGSLLNIPEELCPDEHVERFRYLKRKYATAYELSPELLIQLSADRGRYISQSQSFNYHCLDISVDKLMNYHFKTWNAGLKTGNYYIRQKASVTPLNPALNRRMAKPQNSPPTPKIITCDDNTCCSS